MTRLFIAIFLVSFSFSSVFADTLTGRVVSVADGDTVTVLDAGKQQHKIRLAGIDAPEKNQAYGQASKRSLSDLVYMHDVTVEWAKKDKYGRIVGKVLVSGVDANLEQIKAGMAWHYKQYEREQSPEDRAAYSAAEEEARRQRVGLWKDSNPTPPWVWRHSKR